MARAWILIVVVLGAGAWWFLRGAAVTRHVDAGGAAGDGGRLADEVVH